MKAKSLVSIKRSALILISSALLLSGCVTSRSASDNAGAVWTGAAVGGQVGSAIGGLIGESNHGWRGSYRGSAIGSIVGTVAGAAIAHAITTPREKEERPVHSSPTSSSLEQLQIRNIRFIDEGRNRIVNSGEDCKIIFDIMNEGNHPAYNVVPVVVETTGMKRIHLSPSVMVERINPHEGVKYTANLSAGERIKNGEIVIHIAIADEYGNEYAQQEFTLETRR